MFKKKLLLVLLLLVVLLTFTACSVMVTKGSGDLITGLGKSVILIALT
jgi:predicted small secreted protein